MEPFQPSPPPSPLSPAVLSPYRDGHTVIDGGYRFELCPAHPKANRYGFVPQHRLVLERSLGHYLPAGIQVHHKDRDRLNNALENLHPCTRSEHLRIHRAEQRLRHRAPLTASSVREALRRTGGLKKAAAELKVHTQTLRNRFPAIVAPYKRRTPAKVDDPAAIAKVAELAANPLLGYREVAEQTGLAWMTVRRICQREGIAWSRKSKVGEYHRKKASRPA